MHGSLLRRALPQEQVGNFLVYFAGIAAKFVSGNLNWVLIVYFLNLAALGANWAIYARNLRIDAAYEKAQS